MKISNEMEHDGRDFNKKFRANGVSLSVQLRSFLLDEQHFKELTLELASAFLKYFEFLTEVRRSQIVFKLFSLISSHFSDMKSSKRHVTSLLSFIFLLVSLNIYIIRVCRGV